MCQPSGFQSAMRWTRKGPGAGSARSAASMTLRPPAWSRTGTADGEDVSRVGDGQVGRRDEQCQSARQGRAPAHEQGQDHARAKDDRRPAPGCGESLQSPRGRRSGPNIDDPLCAPNAVEDRPAAPITTAASTSTVKTVKIVNAAADLRVRAPTQAVPAHAAESGQRRAL